MQKYINFDVMITPTIIKILFWVGVVISFLAGLITSFSGLGYMFSPYGGNGFLGFIFFVLGLVIIVAGSLISRIYCELLIVLFKMQESLFSINKKLDSQKIWINKKDSILVNRITCLLKKSPLFIKNILSFSKIYASK